MKTYYKIHVKRVEYYERTFLVPAESEAEANARAQREWNEDDYMWEKTTDYCNDATTEFLCEGIATEQQAKNAHDIDNIITL